tara:strand:- start:495 stop:944 length:450 start_codon:yes stop_codon:yes gene_type:complete
LLKSFRKIFTKKTNNSDEQITENLDILCGLMVEAANTDGEIDDNEISRIHLVLTKSFGENPDEVSLQIKKAIENRNNANSLHFYTSKINKEFSPEKKILLIETLWEIILADGNIHDYESNLIRRLAGLLYVSDVATGNAKKKALNKISQ